MPSAWAEEHSQAATGAVWATPSESSLHLANPLKPQPGREIQKSRPIFFDRQYSAPSRGNPNPLPLRIPATLQSRRKSGLGWVVVGWCTSEHRLPIPLVIPSSQSFILKKILCLNVKCWVGDETCRRRINFFGMALSHLEAWESASH